MAPRLRGVLLRRGSSLARVFALLFLLAACAALIMGLARPQGDNGVRTEKSMGRNLLVALDLSRSMRVNDVKPDRLAQAKMVIYELLDALPNERVGLIGFAGSPYIYAPLTVDHGAVRETVEQIDETWAPLGGSDLASAVHLATETLGKTGQKNNALVILSDGDQHEGNLDAMIREAARSGVYILAIGVGTEDGDYVPNRDFRDNRMVDRAGKPVISRLQPEVMRKLATETKGRYAVAGTGMDIAVLVKSAIKDLDAFEMEGRERGVFIEFYQWLVFPAIVFLFGAVFAGTRWRGVMAAGVAAGVLFLPTGVRADAVAEAKDALEKKCYPEARDAYHQLAEGERSAERRARFYLGEATAAYRAKDYRSARSAFSGALMSEHREVLAIGHSGMGNTLFQLGWQNLAGTPYPEESAGLPDLAQFDVMVNKRLEELRNAPDSVDSAQAEVGGYGRMDALITDWADSIRHFGSALEVDSSNVTAHHNRKLVMAYLNRLEELLEEHQKQSEQLMPETQPGDGQPQPGDGNPKDKKEGGEPGDSGPKPPGDKGEGAEEPKKPSDQGEEKPEDKTGDREGEKPGDSGKHGPKETPEERARRILKENADFEKGPLTPGRHEFRPPEKDW
jgi:Ca-activated chloride channel family protein